MRTIPWIFLILLGLIYAGVQVGWWVLPNTAALFFILLIFILFALAEIGALLERMAPPKETKEERNARYTAELFDAADKLKEKD